MGFGKAGLEYPELGIQEICTQLGQDRDMQPEQELKTRNLHIQDRTGGVQPELGQGKQGDRKSAHNYDRTRIFSRNRNTRQGTCIGKTGQKVHSQN